MRVGEDAELKEKPVLVGVGITEGGALRLMGTRVGVATVVGGMAGAGTWALMLSEEGNGDGETTAGEEDDGTTGGTTEGDVAGNGAGGKAGAGEELGTEHGGVTVTVTAESTKTVSMPFVPVDVKVERPPCAAGFVVVVGKRTGVIVLLRLTLDDVVVVEGVESEGGNNAGVLVGTIPPKLNVFEEDVETNWRLFSLRTGGDTGPAGALRLMIAGLADGCAGAA